jgi:hypothetical protein
LVAAPTSVHAGVDPIDLGTLMAGGAAATLGAARTMFGSKARAREAELQGLFDELVDAAGTAKPAEVVADLAAVRARTIGAAPSPEPEEQDRVNAAEQVAAVERS